MSNQDKTYSEKAPSIDNIWKLLLPPTRIRSFWLVFICFYEKTDLMLTPTHVN